MSYLEENNIEIAFIQETWIKKTDGHLFKQVEEFGYSLLTFRKPRRLDLGGGVAIIFKHNLKLTCMKVKNFRSFESITCKVITQKGAYLFANVYRPDYSAKNRYTSKYFMYEFSHFIDELNTHALPTIIVGDFNFHVEVLNDAYLCNDVTPYETKKRSDAQLLYSLLSDKDLVQLINERTHELGGTLDLLITPLDNSILIDDAHIIRRNTVCESDHNPVFFTIDVIPLLSDDKVTLQYKDFSNLDKDLFTSDFNSSNILL